MLTMVNPIIPYSPTDPLIRISEIFQVGQLLTMQLSTLLELLVLGK